MTAQEIHNVFVWRMFVLILSFSSYAISINLNVEAYGMAYGICEGNTGT
jgi:hypothetical protein